MQALRYGYGFYLLGGILHIIVLIALAAAIYFIVRRWPSRSGVRQLRESFARGEIDEDSYRARLAVLRETARY
jgi:uncharacterized membrane protein